MPSKPSSSPLTALGAQLAKQAKSPSAKPKSPTKSTVAAVPSDAPQTEDGGKFVANIHVRLESREDTHLTNVLMQSLMGKGLRTGHNMVSKTNVIRFALFRWESVAPDEVQSFSKCGERWASQEGRAFVSAHSILLTKDENDHLGALSSQLIKRGMRVGHDGVNNANLARFALVRWVKVTDSDVEAYKAKCADWKAASLAARRARAAIKAAAT